MKLLTVNHIFIPFFYRISFCQPKERMKCSVFRFAGVEFPFIPETNGVPLVVDMSSNIFSRPFDITKVENLFFSQNKASVNDGNILIWIVMLFFPSVRSCLRWCTKELRSSRYHSRHCPWRSPESCAANYTSHSELQRQLCGWFRIQYTTNIHVRN